MRFEQLRTLFRSLRFRLSAWNTAAVLLIVIVTLFGVREALRFTLLNENNQLLKEDTDEVILAVEGLYPDLGQIYNEMDRKAKGHVDRGSVRAVARYARQVDVDQRQTPGARRPAAGFRRPGIAVDDRQLSGRPAHAQQGGNAGLHGARRSIAGHGRQ